VGEDRRSNRGSSDPTENQQRITVHDAARRLGISEDAVRMRVKRGTLSADREGGRLYVLLESEPTTEPTDRTSELIDELRDRVQSLEAQLGNERQAHAEARRIIAGLVERIPAIEAPQEASEASETVEEVPDRAEPQSGAPGPQEGVQRPWWRRVFGGGPG
jgi:hypothetical protein